MRSKETWLEKTPNLSYYEILYPIRMKELQEAWK